MRVHCCCGGEGSGDREGDRFYVRENYMQDEEGCIYVYRGRGEEGLYIGVLPTSIGCERG